MSKRSFTPPGPAVAHNLLSDFICAPVSMRADRFFATIRDLQARIAPGATLTPRADFGDSECYPWEEPIYEIEGGLATVAVAGPLVKGYSDLEAWWYGCMSTDRLQRTLGELATRADVRAIMLRLNTPGGVSTGMPETADQIAELDTQKPVFAFTSDMAASNGYRLAAACRAIICTRSAVLGSIGTYIALYDCSKQLEEMGIKLELFRDGALKGIGVYGKPITEEERAFLQDSVARSGAIFKDLVRSRRPDVAEETMQGQWFDGAQALTLGLADMVYPSESAAAADIRAGLTG